MELNVQVGLNTYFINARTVQGAVSFYVEATSFAEAFDVAEAKLSRRTNKAFVVQSAQKIPDLEKEVAA